MSSPRPIFLRKAPRNRNLDPLWALLIGLASGYLLALFGV